MGVALGWLWVPNRLPISRLWGGFGMALWGFAASKAFKVQGSGFRVQGSGFKVRCWMLDVGCSTFSHEPRLGPYFAD
jgi:hypothetical protein